MAKKPKTVDPLEAAQAAAKTLAQTEWQVETEPDVLSLDAATATIIESVPEAPSAPSEPPPSLTQIVEAALFVGGSPLTVEKFQAATRVKPELFHATVDELNRKYKAQRRPYTLQPKDGGYVLVVRPQFRGLREKLFGGPREARLSQQALDVLSMVAYRQPVEESEIDTVRGYDSGGVLRQLVRLGLVAVLRRGETRPSEVSSGTTRPFHER